MKANAARALFLSISQVPSKCKCEISTRARDEENGNVLNEKGFWEGG